MNIKGIMSEFRLYVCNHIINKIPCHTIRLLYYRKIMGFEIGIGSSIHLGCAFDTARGFKIGKNSVVNANCRIDNRASIVVGDNVSISQNVILLTADHDMDSADFQGRNSPIEIKDYVWIGTRAMLLPGVTIEEKAVVAAGSLVTKSVNSLMVVAGVPAKIIKERNKTDYTYSASYKRLFQ